MVPWVIYPLFLLLWPDFASSSVWSIPAFERWKANAIASSSSPAETKMRMSHLPQVALFYGSWKERRQARRCDRLRCQFIHEQCITGATIRPPSMSCFNVLASMSKPDAGNCPYIPCEGYNQNGDTKCIAQGASCQERVHFGLCQDNTVCCMVPPPSDIRTTTAATVATTTATYSVSTPMVSGQSLPTSGSQDPVVP